MIAPGSKVFKERRQEEVGSLGSLGSGTRVWRMDRRPPEQQQDFLPSSSDLPSEAEAGRTFVWCSVRDPDVRVHLEKCNVRAQRSSVFQVQRLLSQSWLCCRVTRGPPPPGVSKAPGS